MLNKKASFSLDHPQIQYVPKTIRGTYYFNTQINTFIIKTASQHY